MIINATLISWAPSTGALTYSVEGVTQTSTVMSTTHPHRAALNVYYPTDPIRPIVTRWNALIDAIIGPATFGQTNTDVPNSFSGITAELAAATAKMAIHLEPHSNIVAALHPIPFIPGDPIIPPNPV